VRKERLFGYVGLAAFFLFPLVSLLQLRDSDDVWRKVADRTRPSVLEVRAGEGEGVTAGCAVVLGARPLRAAVVGVPIEGRLVSVTAAGTREWRVAWVDPQGAFSILASDDTSRGPEPLAALAAGADRVLSEIVPLPPSTLEDTAPPEDLAEGVTAVLVGPAHAAAEPIWVGVLRMERDAAGRPTYHGGPLRPVRATEALAAAEAGPEAAQGLHPALRGAPFVSQDGVVVGLYAGTRDGAPQAVPLALVREAVAAMERRAQL
jgi:hypothetical protein